MGEEGMQEKIILSILLLVLFSLGTAVYLTRNTTNAIEITPLDQQRDVSINGDPHINISTYRLAIEGMVEKPLSLTYDQIVLAYPSYQRITDLHCVEGWSFTGEWYGPKVTQIITDAVPKTGATHAVFYSADGYSTSLSLDYLTNQNIILAYKINNVTLPSDRGFPFQLVAESKYGYKWAKWITRIEITNESKKGYWESRGYDDEADVYPS